MKKLLLMEIICLPMLLNAQNLVLNGDFEKAGTAPQSFANWSHSLT